jgi:hypothetical protein
MPTPSGSDPLPGSAIAALLAASAELIRLDESDTPISAVGHLRKARRERLISEIREFLEAEDAEE